MKNKLVKRLALLALAYAPCAFAGSGWVNVTVSQAGSWQENSGEYFISIDRVINTEGCTQNVPQLRWSQSTVSANSTYATILAAIASGHTLMVYVYGCTQAGWPQLWGAQIAPSVS
jgi:hypothetical protein